MTIIEFSDFQCPFCHRSVGYYGNFDGCMAQVRVVYRDFPGQNHPQALPAAEAAECAQEQGKFWDSPRSGVQPSSAGGILELQHWRRTYNCMPRLYERLPEFRSFSSRDLQRFQDGLRLASPVQPTFFINGRPLIGAQPISAFQALIDQALQDQQHS